MHSGSWRVAEAGVHPAGKPFVEEKWRDPDPRRHEHLFQTPRKTSRNISGHSAGSRHGVSTSLHQGDTLRGLSLSAGDHEAQKLSWINVYEVQENMAKTWHYQHGSKCWNERRFVAGGAFSSNTWPKSHGKYIRYRAINKYHGTEGKCPAFKQERTMTGKRSIRIINYHPSRIF